MAREPREFGMLVPAITGAALVAALFYLGLSLVARPHDLARRLANANRTVEDAGSLRATVGASAFPSGAICTGSPEQAQDVVRRQLGDAASESGLAVSNVSLTPGVADEARGGLTPITIQFETSGRYVAILTMLGALSKAKPEVFVDTLDLKSQVSTVALKINGRVFCSTAGPL